MASPKSRFIQFACAIAGLAAAVAVSAMTPAEQKHIDANAEQRRPVLVELFTSEGCSDCPPADALLAELDQQQFVPGADAIVLSEHVTYWNHEGWRDPFSLATVDDRQRAYAREFALNDVYTPQAVVDGAEQFVGSDAAKLKLAVARAANKPVVEIEIAKVHREPDGTIEFAVLAGNQGKGRLVAALAENATVSEVSRGENAGRTLHHVAVVRAMKEFSGKAADGRMLQLKEPNGASGKDSGEPLRVVVFLEDGWNGHVMGAAEQTLRPDSPAISAR